MAQPKHDPEPELPEGEEGEQAAPKGGGKKKIFIILGVVVLFLLGGGAGAYFMGFLDPLFKKEAAVEGAAEDGAAAEGAHGDAAKGEKTESGGHGGAKGENGEATDPASLFLKIPDMVVNLSTEDRTPHFLRLGVQLEFKTVADKMAVEALMPRIVDQFQTYLRELRVQDLKGSAGVYRLQMELLSRVNQAAAPVQVQDVLFQEILIQ